MNALRHLEQGEGASVKTLIRVARALGRQDWLMNVANFNLMTCHHDKPQKTCHQVVIILSSKFEMS